MKRLLALISAGIILASHTALALDAAQVNARIGLVADWQLKHLDTVKPRDWTAAPLLDGLIDASLTTGDPRYLAAVIRIGTAEHWDVGPRIHHADDLAVAHAWLRIYAMKPERGERLTNVKNRLDSILIERTHRWTWIDALYMAPPTFAALAQITGRTAYLEFTDREFKSAFEKFFDPEESLFFRDETFVQKRGPNGEKLFWSRGNGWVFAGLAQLLDHMPKDHPARDFYAQVYTKMAASVAKAQQQDGFWYPNLTDSKHVSQPETSGTGLFVFGLAWGVRNGVLDRNFYWPIVERGWAALVTQVTSDGVLNSVQPIGAEPKEFPADSHATYGTGAFLMAGSQIAQALQEPSVVNAALIDSAELAARDGGTP